MSIIRAIDNSLTLLARGDPIWGTRDGKELWTKLCVMPSGAAYIQEITPYGKVAFCKEGMTVKLFKVIAEETLIKTS